MPTASKPPISPGIWKDGLSEAKPCIFVSGRHVLVPVEDDETVLVLHRMTEFLK